MQQKKGHFKCVEALIQAGAGVNLPGKNGETSLGISAAMGNNECVKFLIQNGVNVNPSNLENIVTPLGLCNCLWSNRNHENTSECKS